MTVFDPLLGGHGPEHEHDVLLVAGSRPEVARLAPVAASFAAVDRIRAITVATGPDPMAVHETFDALGVPTDITVLLPSGTAPGIADVAAALMVRLDRLMVDQDPSAILVHGGGIAASVAATVAFWRRIPVVHMQAGMGADDLLCPFPQEAHRRVIGQLASLFLTTRGAALGSPLGPNVLTVGDTVNALPLPEDPSCADAIRRVRGDLRRMVLVALNRPSSYSVLAGIGPLLERHPDIEVVLTGEQADGDAASSLGRHPRVVVAPRPSMSDLVVVLAAATVLVCDDPDLVGDAPGLGTAAVLVDGPDVPQPGDSIRSTGGSSALPVVGQILDGGHGRRPAPSDGLEAARAEQAVAWMFGLCGSPHLPDDERSGAQDAASGSTDPAESSGA